MAIDMFRRGTRLANGDPIASGELPGPHRRERRGNKDKRSATYEYNGTGVRWITNAGVRERPSTPKIISPTYPTSLAKKNSHLTGLRNQLLATFSTLFPNVADSSNV
jgi:hypothetical protein